MRAYQGTVILDQRLNRLHDDQLGEGCDPGKHQRRKQHAHGSDEKDVHCEFDDSIARREAVIIAQAEIGVLANCSSCYNARAIFRRFPPPWCAKMPKPALDAIDARIIAALQADARLSNTQLSALVGLSPSPCLRRVKRLESEGYIEGYRAILQRDRVGLGLTVFVTVKIDGHADARADAFQDALVAMPEVTACHMTSGEADYLIEVTVPDREHYQAFLLGKLLDLPIVKEIRSHIAIQSLKTSAPLPLGHLGSAMPLSR